jgi:hypothetical protein
MSHRAWRAGWFALVLVALLLVLAAGSRVASAQEVGYDSLDGCSGSWQRQFGVDVLILDCKPGYATDHDRAYMFARHSVDTSAAWRSQVDLTDAVWVFDAAARGKPSLIIDFHREGRKLVATIYDDVNRDGEIRYGLERGIPKSTESRFPTVTVSAPDGWWVRDGKVNYNLEIVVDGPVFASWTGEVFYEYQASDGTRDVTIDVMDPSGTGRPERQIVQAYPPLPESSGVIRTSVMVNEGRDELIPDTYILWPHLGYYGPIQPRPDPPIRAPLSSLSPGYGIVKDYRTAFPPIQIAWTESYIRFIGEFVASRGQAHNWFTYSLLRFGEDGRVDANMENPFAFYDLAGAGDGYPDLQIRDEHIIADDIFTPPGVTGPYHEIRYSWDPEHRHRWLYKVGLSGRRPMPAVVGVAPDVRLATVPYADYPGWVMGHAWETADFTAVERSTYWTTEGIYELCGLWRSDYASGRSQQKPRPDQILRNLPGIRCEYASVLGERPRLYVNAVDQKLHLNRAEAGLWTITARDEDFPDRPSDEIWYRALDSPYINHWERQVDGVVVEALTSLSDRLVYVEPGAVHIAAGPRSIPVRFVDPPTNPAQMREFRELTGDVLPPGQGGDLSERFDQFQDERVVLPDATLWDLAADGTGFRFLLHLTEPVPDVPWASALSAGDYMVRYQPGTGFTAEPAKRLPLTITPPQLKGDAPIELMPIRIGVEVHNPGDEVVPDLRVVFSASRPDRGVMVLGSSAVTVPAAGTAPAEVVWSPPAPGEWTVSAAIVGAGATPASATAATVAPALTADPTSVLLAQGLRPFAGGLISASLTLAVAIACGFGFVLWRLPGRPGPPGADDR